MFREINNLHKEVSKPIVAEAIPEDAMMEEPQPTANLRKIDFDTELALNVIEFDAFDEGPAYRSAIKSTKDFLVSNKLVADESEIDVIRGPFVELENAQMEAESLDLPDLPLEKKLAVDEEFDIKCTICPKANSKEGFKIFNSLAMELNQQGREKYKN